MKIPLPYRRLLVTGFFVFIGLSFIYHHLKDLGYGSEPYISEIFNIKFPALLRQFENLMNTREKVNGFILNTPGCKIPKFDPFDPTVNKFYEERNELNCRARPMFLSTNPGGSISLNKTILQTYYNVNPDDIFCVFRGILRKFLGPNVNRENGYYFSDYDILDIDVPLDYDHVEVLCDLGGKENLTHYFPLVQLKEEIENVKARIPPPNPQLNVIVQGIDSISKLNFMRHMQKTGKFLETKGNWFEMKGYVKVGINTFPNMMPLLTGQPWHAIWNITLKDTMYFDDVEVIWKKYSNKGYRTFFAEDSPFLGTFNYRRRGFNVTPTDYYMRPLYLVLQNSLLRKKGNYYCFNSVPEPKLMYDYVTDFVKTMESRPYFAFALTSTLTHDNLNYAGYIDHLTADYFNDLWNSGVFNNTMFVFYSDHGVRYGGITKTYIGKYEERMPFLFIHFPTWFLEQHPRLHKNLKDNTERLTTLFDVYATMVHVLNISKAHKPREISPYGVSLLDKISPYRDCNSAGILPEFCVCQVYKYISPLDPKIIKATQAVDETLQNILSGHMTKCAAVTIDEVTETKIGQLNDIVLGSVTVKYEDVSFMFSTNSCGHVFEATVRHDMYYNSYDVAHLRKINVKPTQKNCIQDKSAEQFCCCK